MGRALHLCVPEAPDSAGKEAWDATGTGSGEITKLGENLFLTAPLGLVAKSQLRG